VFVRGDGRRMAPAVREAFMTIYSVHTGAGDNEARTWLASLTESGHYIEEVWAG
jgi:cytochrome P450 / NADPH-cytochrome P450 reductase